MTNMVNLEVARRSARPEWRRRGKARGVLARRGALRDL